MKSITIMGIVGLMFKILIAFCIFGIMLTGIGFIFLCLIGLASASSDKSKNMEAKNSQVLN